jgi:hypothetical protein
MQLQLKNNTIIEIMQCDLPEVYTWHQAVALCQLIGSNWRLPTINEIQEIYSKKEEFSFANCGYWAYWTCNETNVEKANCLSGPNGEILKEKKEAKLYIRLVKSI